MNPVKKLLAAPPTARPLDALLEGHWKQKNKLAAFRGIVLDHFCSVQYNY